MSDSLELELQVIVSWNYRLTELHDGDAGNQTCGCWEVNSIILQEHYVLLITEPSLQGYMAAFMLSI